MTERIMPAVPVVYPEWVTVRKAATIANRKVRTIYDWIDQGRIASKREVGGRGE